MYKQILMKCVIMYLILDIDSAAVARFYNIDIVIEMLLFVKSEKLATIGLMA